MEDRILINGVWYVRETEPETETKEIETTDLICSVYETEDYVWKATRIYKDDGETLYPGFDVDFTDKTKTPWKTEDWDNKNWFNGVLENDRHSMKLAGEAMDNEGIKHLKAFLKYLKDKGWF